MKPVRWIVFWSAWTVAGFAFAIAFRIHYESIDTATVLAFLGFLILGGAFLDAFLVLER